MKKALAVIGMIVAVLGGMALLISLNLGENTDKVYEASEESGNIPEKVIGDASKARVIVYEYADYGCTHCAEWNETITRYVEYFNGDLAVVFRGYDLGYQNGHAVAVAATAAQLQGYWKEFKDVVFATQEEWFYSSSSDLQEQLVDYFNEASSGKGDVEKFLSDLKSDDVEKRVNFENKIGKKANIEGTPTFRLGGKAINPSNLKELVTEKLSKK